MSFAQLPIEIRLKIAEYVHFSSLTNFAASSSLNRNIISNNQTKMRKAHFAELEISTRYKVNITLILYFIMIILFHCIPQRLCRQNKFFIMHFAMENTVQN